MNDSLLVSVLHRVADLYKQLEPRSRRESVLVAVARDGHAAHKFHREVGTAGVGGTGVEHAGDIRMIHARDRLSLGLEARDHFLGVHAEFNYLQGHSALHGFVLLGHVDDTAAALTNLLQQLVTSDDLAALGDGMRPG